MPATCFPYSVVNDYEIINGKAQETQNFNQCGVIQSLKLGSFAGIVKNSQNKSEIDEIEDLYKNFKEIKNTKVMSNNDLGKAIDLISLCMQIDPNKRPTIKALLNSSVFSLDKYEEKQAKSFAELIFQHKNPEILITDQITKPLLQIKSENSFDLSEEIINIIEKLGCALLNFEDSIITNTFKAISSTNLSGKEKDSLLKKNINSPITELSNQAITDDIFSILCSFSLQYFHKGNSSVLMSFANLLKYLLFHLNSEESGLSSLVAVLIETLLKLFIGEDTCLASKNISSGYVLKESFWTPGLYEIVSPLYRQSISESGFGQHNCPIIKEFLTKNRSPEYFSELLMLAENFSLIRKAESSTVSKRNALRHIKSMLLTKNEYKTLAALDFKLPQMIIPCIQDSDYKVRAEAIEIFLIISEGCVQPLLPKLPGVNKDYRALGIINFYSIAKKKTHESTKNFSKFSNIKDGIPLAIKELALCFENPLFVFPIVRLVKFKSEPYDTKEVAVKILINALQGNEKSQLACLSPITDTISTLCKCLVVSSKTTDKKSNKSLAPLIKELLGKLLANARFYILAAFKNTPGAEALLKEQNLVIPEKVTLQTIKNMRPSGYLLENNIEGVVQGVKNWLVHEYIPEKFTKSPEIILDSFEFLKNSVDFYWNIASNLSENPAETTNSAKKSAKDKLRVILLFFE